MSSRGTPSPRLCRQSVGFTLVEVIAAMTILVLLTSVALPIARVIANF